MSSILVTGADGYLGRGLTDALLARTDARLTLLVRATTAAEHWAKLETLPAAVVDNPRVAVVPGDLTTADPLAAVDPRDVDAVVHAAAVTRFDVDRVTAQRVNVDGTRRVLAFAERCPRLQRLLLVSTLYASGLSSGPVVEQRLARRPFANHYEWSKWSAEQLVHGARHLPTAIVRTATMIADDADGHAGQRNVFHQTLRLLQAGLLPVLPGVPGTPLYLVTRRHVVDALVALLDGEVGSGVYHASHDRAAAVTLDGLLDVAFSRLAQDEGFRRRRVLRPPYVDLQAFRSLQRGAMGFAGDLVTAALQSMAPFAPQLYSTKDVCTQRGAAAGASRPDDPADLAAAVCDRLAASRRSAARVRVA